MMQLAYGLKQAGIDAEVVNISQLCDEELRGRPAHASREAAAGQPEPAGPVAASQASAGLQQCAA